MGEHDELFSELREAWKGVQVPEPADAREDLDPATRQALEWMRAAWSQLEVPEPELPARRGLRLLSRRVRIGLAAAAVLMLSVATWRFTMEVPATSGDMESERTAQVRSPPGTGNELTGNELTGISPTLTPPPVITSIGSNNIELRSGPVTLVLVTSDAGG